MSMQGETDALLADATLRKWSVLKHVEPWKLMALAFAGATAMLLMIVGFVLLLR